MKIIVTGAAGFLGQYLTRALITTRHALAFDELLLVDVIPPARPNSDRRIRCQAVDLAAPGTIEALLYTQPDIVFHLAAVVSGQAEADFEFGMKVNFDVSQHLLETIRLRRHTTRFIMSSSVAVFGGILPSIVSDQTPVRPQSSYGTQKAMCELLIQDYTRRGFVDGRVLRLPTVCVRPGKPNQATSSFASSIIRDPLQGKQAICPVSPELALWLASPASVTYNLLHAASLPATSFTSNCVINLPGITVTVQEIIDALSDIGGAQVADLIHFSPYDDTITRIVSSWPSHFDVTTALEMGFQGDTRIHDLINHFIHHDLQGAPQ